MEVRGHAYAFSTDWGIQMKHATRCMCPVLMIWESDMKAATRSLLKLCRLATVIGATTGYILINAQVSGFAKELADIDDPSAEQQWITTAQGDTADEGDVAPETSLDQQIAENARLRQRLS